MNRKQRVLLIVRVLLFPYTRQPFTQEDLLLKKAQIYREMSLSSGGLYRQKSAVYNQLRQRLEERLQEEIPTCKLSEINQLQQMFYGEEELTAYLQRSRSDSLDGYYCQKLQEIAAEFITLRDGRVSIRMWESQNPRSLFHGHSGLYKVEIWSELSRTITPDVLIAAYFVACGVEQTAYLASLPDNVFLSDSLLARINHQGLAETHLHLSAGMSYLSVWEVVSDISAMRLVSGDQEAIFQRMQQEESQSHPELLIAGWLRLMFAKFLREAAPGEDLTGFFSARSGGEPFRRERHILRHVLSNRLTLEDAQHLMNFLHELSPSLLQHLEEVYSVEQSDAFDLLIRGPYRTYRHLNTSPELLLLYEAQRHIRDYPEHQNFTHAFLEYLRIKNQYFSNKLQSTGSGGLRFFQRYFAKASGAIRELPGEDRQKLRLAYQAAFRSQRQCADLKKLEIKISPNIPVYWESGVRPSSNTLFLDQIRVADQLIEIFTAYQTVLQETVDRTASTVSMPMLGIVYHFIKKDFSHLPLELCWVSWEGHEWPDYISLVRSQCFRFLDALQGLLQQIPHLSEYVVGVDAASSELEAEPWIYAPVYRHARNRYNTLPIQLQTGEPLQNIGLTYHVGEDYHHILSGLRHIDEVLTYFGYKAGDRIGHGLAMQVQLEDWIRNNEVVSLPILEHMENLLWLWKLCGEQEAGLAQYLPELEQEILQIAEEIYGNLRGITPYLLWRTYTRKFEELSDEFFEQMQSRYLSHNLRREDRAQILSDPPPSQRSFCFLHQVPNNLYCALTSMDMVWDSDKLLLTHRCPIYNRHYQRPLFVTNDRTKLAMYQAVQKYVRRKVQKMGVFVETNPTSNMVIGDIDSLYEYPITTLNAKGLSSEGAGSVLLSINSDDPLVFNTNVENEIALIYHILTYRGLSREEVLEWTNRVRQYGMDSSFIRRVLPPDQQQKQLSQLIKDLREFSGTAAM